MTEREVKELLLVVQSHYQYFKVDEIVLKEWYNLLKEYKKEDVYDKFKKHLVGDYKDSIPNIAYIVKYLTPIKDEGKPLVIRCQLCGDKMFYEDYNKHYSRELSVDYIEKQAMKHFDKQIDRKKYLGMNEIEFQSRYDELIERILEKTNDKDEKRILSNIIATKNGGEIEFDKSLI